MRANHVKRRLEAGEPSIGTFLALPSPEAAEQVSRLGFDWLVVDTEHYSVDIGTLSAMFTAMARSGTAPMARVPTNAPEHIRRPLDAVAWASSFRWSVAERRQRPRWTRSATPPSGTA